MKKVLKNIIAWRGSRRIFLTFLKNKKGTILPFIIVFSLPVLLYLQTLSFGFTYFDDDGIIVDNITFLSDFRNAPHAFLIDASLVKSCHFYRPLQTVSYMADISLSGGNNTWMYHLTNILLLGLIACLLFLLLRKFLIPLKLAILSTLVYCAHPLFTSSISWIPARGDLLLAFFSLLSFLFFIEHLQKKRLIYLLFHWIAFTIALFCKENAVSLLLLFIIYYFAFSSEKRSDNYRNEKKYLLNIVLYAISVISWFWVRSIAIGNSSISNEIRILPIISNIQTIPESLVMFLFPFDIKQIPSFSVFKTVIGLVIIFIMIVLFFNNKERSKKEKVFCLCWFLFLLLPTLLYKNEHIDYLNHRFFLPMVGILLFVLFVFPKKWFEKAELKGLWLMIAVLIILSSVTFVKSRSYSDPMTFWNSSISQSPTNVLNYVNRGNVKNKRGDFQEAINDYTKAIKLSPNFALAYYNRGNAYGTMGDIVEAIKDYNKAIALNHKDANYYYNRGTAFLAKGDLVEAIKDFDKAIALSPNFAEAYNNRGNVYFNEENLEMATKDFDKAIELDPNYAEAYANRGNAFGYMGNLEMAINDYTKAIRLNPYYAEAYYNRGMAYKAKGVLNEAEQDFKMYEELKNKYSTHSN